MQLKDDHIAAMETLRRNYLTKWRGCPNLYAPAAENQRRFFAVASLFAGKNPFVNELTEKHNIPVGAALGGAETIYPE